MSFKKIVGLLKDILVAVLPIIRKNKKVEDIVILILEVAIVILGVILAI